MKIPCKNIPTFDFETKKWSTTSFTDQYEFGQYLLDNCFKEPGEYKFDKELTKELWNEHSNRFLKENRYVDFAPGTQEYNDFWNTEELKCRLGVIWKYKELVYYTTNDYYFLLNYIVLNNKEQGYIKTFAEPRDVQYHMMMYEKIAECFDLNSVILKRRQMMFSVCHVAKSVNYLFFEYTKRIKWGAYDNKYILDPINGSWTILDISVTFLNQNTGWGKDFSPNKPGSIMQRVQVQDNNGRWYWEGNETSIVANTYSKDPAAGVGGATTWLWYEEGGLSPTAHLTLQYLEPAIKSGGKRMGSFTIGGSVGDLDQCKPLKDFTLNPEVYGFLATPTKWYDETGIQRNCGLFIPAQYGMPEATDEHGNSLVELALSILEKSENEGWKPGEMKGNILIRSIEKAWVDLPPEDFVLAKSQNPKNIKEAFAFRGVSVFNIPACERRQEEIKILTERGDKFHKQGLMSRNSSGKPYLKELKDFKSDNKPEEIKYPVDPTLKDKRGVVNIYEEPKKDLIYRGGVDSIEAEITTTSNSLFSIHIYRRSYTELDTTTGQQKTIRGKIVADWAGRFDSVEETNEHAMLLLEYYNAIASCERNKPNFINHCRRNGKTHLIASAKDLPFDKDIDITGKENGQYGVYRDSAGKVLTELLRVSKEYLNSEMDIIYLDKEEKIRKIIKGYDYIEGYWTLEEMKLYNKDDNADRVDSLLYCLHYAQNEELTFQNKVVKVQTEVKELKFKELPKIKKYGTTITKYGQPRNLLNY